jgi:ABC-type transporter Mla MlaB component
VQARPFEISLNTPSREVRVSGILVGFIAARAVLNAVYALLDEEEGPAEIDMSQVSAIDDEVIATVVRVWEEQHRDGFSLAVVDAPAGVKRAFVAAGHAALLA